MKRSSFIVIFILFLTTICNGQATRIEIKLNRIPNDMEIISLNRNGFIMLYTGGDRRGNSFNSWNITKFNTNFEEQWNKLLDIPSRFSIRDYLADTTSNKFIWVSESASQLRIDIIDLKNGQNSSQTYSLAKHSRQIVSSKLVGDNFYILFKYGPDDQASNCFSTCCFPIAIPLRIAGLSLFKYGSLYTRIDLVNQLKYEQADVSKSISFPDKIQNKINRDTSISVSSFKRKPHSHGATSLVVKNLDKKLKTTDSIIINCPDNFFLQNIQLIGTDNGVAGVGTFDNTAPDPDEDVNTINAMGFYTTIIDSNKEVKAIKLFNFSEIKSFETYIEDINSGGHDISDTKKTRLKKRYKNYSTMLRFNEIVVRENDFIATAEAFYPVYSYYRDANGNNIQYFEGYNYTHCLIICFDKQGNIKWDKTVPLNFNRLYLSLNQKIKVLQDKENVQLSYSSGGNINVITITEDNITEPKNLELPRLLKEDEKASEYMADVTPWYGHKYLIWGVQKIKKSDLKDREGSNLIYLDEMEVK